ncbi:hypothetical protein GCM10027020_22740 [Nocardioides salsibiostraticola]
MRDELDDNHAPVRHEIALQCVDEHDRPLIFMATFAYHPATPYAVSITCHLVEADYAWTVERSLIEAGLKRRVGFGMVRVAPARCDAGWPMVAISLLSAAGSLETKAELGAIQRFLAETRRLVPTGTESTHVDLDELVAELLEP